MIVLNQNQLVKLNFLLVNSDKRKELVDSLNSLLSSYKEISQDLQQQVSKCEQKDSIHILLNDNCWQINKEQQNAINNANFEIKKQKRYKLTAYGIAAVLLTVLILK